MGPDLPITLVWRRWDDGGGGGETIIAVVVVVVVMAVVVVATSERRTTDDARDTIVRVLESNRIESNRIVRRSVRDYLGAIGRRLYRPVFACGGGPGRRSSWSNIYISTEY
jgi:hypothetical protein